MPQLTFIAPQHLWLLLLVPPLWAAALISPPRIARWRRRASLALRSLIAICLVLALAGAQIATPVGAVTTVFLLDTSDSVALAQRARAEAFVQQALAAMPPDDRAAIVVFGEQALVERPPSPDRVLGQVISQPRGVATDIQSALQLATAMLPPEGHRRIVLLSDGGETIGEALEEARRAAALGIPIDIIPLSGAADGLDARIVAVELPAAAREGQRLRLRLDVESSQAVNARLVVDGPGGSLVDQAVELPAGTQRLEVLLPAAPPGFSRYVVRLNVPGDARPQNNAAETYSFVAGRPRALLVEGEPGASQNLARALGAAQIEAIVVAPGDAPRQIGDLAGYDIVALVDVPRSALPDSTASALSAFVHDLGRGLIMVGGPHSFGAGGWRDTPVEAALPVTMDIPALLRMPPVSVVIVIDVSGSMGQEEGGRTKLSLALEGAQRIAALLRDEDELTVIPFDDQPRGVVGPLPGSRREEAIEALSQVELGGGGITIHDALVEAEKYIMASDRPVRHIITITDGSDTTQQEGALEIVQRLRAARVTLTSIAVGQGEHVPFIRDMASVGGGRTFLTDQASNLPTLLVDEAQAVIQPYFIEEEFTPVRGVAHPALRDVAASPPLLGYVLTTPRPSAQVLLAAPQGQAVLAAWQYGLGRSMAWTSDFTGRWGKEWVAWDQFPRLAAQLFAWLLPRLDTQALALETSVAGGDLVLSARARDARGAPLTGLQLRATMVGAAGQPVEVALRETAPGQYRAAIAGQPPGAYLVQLVAADARGEPVAALTAGAVVPLSGEYRGGEGNPALLDALARATGGRVSPSPAEAFAPGGAGAGAVREVGLPLLVLALLLLPLDIAVRRVMPGWRLAAARQPEAAREPRPAVEPAPRQAAPDPPAGRRRPRSQSAREDELARLREAQERARKRARGEE